VGEDDNVGLHHCKQIDSVVKVFDYHATARDLNPWSFAGDLHRAGVRHQQRRADAPKVAEQLWTFPAPKGPKGRHISGRYRYWGIWNFSANKSAAKSLLLYHSTREAIGKLLEAGQGFDVPPFEKLDSPVWADAEPSKGTLYNFPPRGEVIVSVAGSPAPARIGVQMYAQGTMCKMIAQCTQQGKSIDEAITFGERELEAYMRI
jgi:hypothetical protein